MTAPSIVVTLAALATIRYKIVNSTNKTCADCGVDLPIKRGSGRRPTVCSPCSKKRNLARTRTYICKHCATSFLEQSRRAFCSVKCRTDFEETARIVAKKKKEKVCLGCGVAFVPRRAKYGKYCSRSCAHSNGACHKHRADYLAGEGKSCTVYFKKCGHCARTFTARKKQTPVCSDECRKAVASAKELARNKAQHVEKQVICPECRNTFTTEYGKKNRKFCSAECLRRHGARVNKGKRKARTLGVGSERIDPFIVFDIYGWECAQCKTPTPKHLRGTHEDDAPELDHIHPLSKGGLHTYTNVQLLCRKCNGEKSDTITPTP